MFNSNKVRYVFAEHSIYFGEDVGSGTFTRLWQNPPEMKLLQMSAWMSPGCRQMLLDDATDSRQFQVTTNTAGWSPVTTRWWQQLWWWFITSWERCAGRICKHERPRCTCHCTTAMYCRSTAPLQCTAPLHHCSYYTEEDPGSNPLRIIRLALPKNTISGLNRWTSPGFRLYVAYNRCKGIVGASTTGHHKAPLCAHSLASYI